MMPFKNSSYTFFVTAISSLGKCVIEWLNKERNEFYNHRTSGHQYLFPASAIKIGK